MEGVYISAEYKELAFKIIQRFSEELGHIELDNVIFIEDIINAPKNTAARTYYFGCHPIEAFTDAKYAIVMYKNNIEYMSENQIKIVLYHELLHIPSKGEKATLIPHDIMDFHKVLSKFGIDWNDENKKVIDILGGENND
jgi:predicted metallopeptidase